MPFTPFHLGPGAAFKAIGADRFSFLIFVGSQVLMDIEPLVRMIRGDRVLHGISHSIAGALVIGGVSTLAGVPIVRWTLRHAADDAPLLTWRLAAVSALMGTYSHIMLDAIMHADMHPLWPFAPANPLLGALSVGALHMVCLACGIAGLAVIGLRAVRRG